jgi:hypothetical protein
MIDRDLSLLAAFEAQVAEADQRLAALLPRTPFAVLCSGPGWRVVRAATYGAAVGDPDRWRERPPPLPGQRAVPSNLRLSRPPPRRHHQPRRLGHPAPGRAVAGGRAVAAGPRRPRLRRLPAGPRQAARSDRHRHGQPGQPDRVRHGQRPTTLRSQPVEVNQALSDPDRTCQAGRLGGRIRHRRRFGGLMVTPRQAWCPASRHPAEPGRGQLTRSHARSHRSALGPQTRPARAPTTGQHTAEPSDRKGHLLLRPPPLDTTYSQLANEARRHRGRALPLHARWCRSREVHAPFALAGRASTCPKQRFAAVTDGQQRPADLSTRR